MAIQSRYFSSTAVKTTLVSAITNTATSFSVGSTTGWPVSLPFTLIIDRDLATEEVIEVTTISGTNITACTRGKDGTTAVAHSAGATVEHGVSARDFNDPQAHMSAFTAVHGLQTGSDVVGTTDAQTLTNKTLTSPVISSISNTGTVTLPTSTDTLVGRATTDTLTNKTIDTAGPNTLKINGNTLTATAGTATVTIPNATDTLVGRATSDTLTNKVLTIANGGAALNWQASHTTATAGTSGSLPAQVAGYIDIQLNGTTFKVPVYNV